MERPDANVPAKGRSSWWQKVVTPQGSLRNNLVRSIAVPLSVVILLSMIPTYFLSVSAANQAFDSALLDPALAIKNSAKRTATTLEFELSPETISALRIDSRNRIFINVRGIRGESVIGNNELELPANLRSSEHRFYDSTVEGEHVRVVDLPIEHPIGTAHVVVAETYGERDQMIREILLGTAASEILIACAAIFLLWRGVSRGLRPMIALSDEIATRSPRDLRDVNLKGKPDELTPIVSALNHLLEQLRESSERKQRFISNAAHQLRTPLSGLKMHAELARRQRSGREMQELLGMITREADRSAHLVNQLLALARAETGALEEPQLSPINLHEIGNRSVQVAFGQAVAKNIDLGYELEEAWIDGDPLLLRELLTNLIDNSIAYTDAGGSVTIRTFTAKDIANIEVEDTGRGIPDTERRRVFERFYRSPGTPGEGCGLGLAIVAEIAKRLGGQVEVHTPTSGEGTLIRVSFPISRAREASTEKTASPQLTEAFPS